MAGLRPAPALGNRPGDLTCPNWLFELDDPAPGRAILGTASSPQVLRWFHDRRIPVDLVAPGTISLPPPAPLLVLDSRLSGSAGRRLQDPTWLRATNAVVLARAPDAAWARALRAAGLGRIRAVRTQGAPRRPAATVHLASAPRTPDAGRVDLPAWLASLLPPGGLPGRATWSLRVPTAYPSQKAVAIVPADDPTGTVVVKVTRHPRFNERLENEAATLETIAGWDESIARRVPRMVATGEVAGLAAVAQQAIAGEPFLRRAALRPGCDLAEDAVAAITDVGATTRRNDAGAWCGRLEGLLERFVEGHAPPPAVAAHLTDQVARLVADPPPAVLFHGDLGTWNLWVDPGDHVWILDWESAELAGPPLWDLLYFARSLAVRAGRRRGQTRHRAIGRHLLGSSPLALQTAGWVQRYGERLELAPRQIEALLHTCWMHRAVKEQARLLPGDPGHYGPLCIRMIEQRDAPGLRRLVGR
jgi:hypothetical protein